MTQLSGQARIFKQHICDNLCKLCNNISDNAFCRILFALNKKEFEKFLLYVITLEALKDKRLRELRTFEAFSSLFCGLCKQRMSTCLPTKNQIVCYDAFLRQNREELNSKTKADIYEKYAGVAPALIGLDYDLNDISELQLKLSVKVRKSLRRRVKNAIKKVKKHILPPASTTKSTNEKVVPVETTCFYNDNIEWERELERIFSNENNNRQ